MEASPARRRLRPPSPDTEEALGSLASLPPELLNEILSRLPLRDAVRISALARAWRRRWESVSSLSFRWTGRSDPGAISDVLRRYSCPFLEFRHDYVEEALFGLSDCWLRLLALKGVQSLYLDFEDDDDELLHTLHPSMYSCRQLTVLHLRGCNVPAPAPGFTGLPNLTVLSLNHAGFPEGARVLELLIATSPLLESIRLEYLSIPYSSGYHPWIIQAPKLRSLYIEAMFDDEWEMNDLPSLEEANIDLVGYSPDRDLSKLMIGLAHAKKLKVTLPTNGHILEGLSYPFVNLKSLSLRTSLRFLSSVSSIFCLLRNTPELEVLDFELEEHYFGEDDVGRDFLNALWTDDLFSNLIHVVVTYVACVSSEMHFIEFVLSKARRLQELHVCLDAFCTKSNEEAVIELVKYQRASPRAKVFFSRK